MTFPSLCPSHLTPCSFHTYPLPQVFNLIKNLLLLSYCIVCIVLNARVTNRLHKKPVTLQSIYAKVHLLLSLSLIQLYFHYDSNTIIGLFTIANNNFYQIQPGKRSYMDPTLVVYLVLHGAVV